MCESGRDERADQYPVVVRQQSPVSLSRRHDEAGQSQLVCVHDHPCRSPLHLAGVRLSHLISSHLTSSEPDWTKSVAREHHLRMHATKDIITQCLNFVWYRISCPVQFNSIDCNCERSIMFTIHRVLLALRYITSRVVVM